MKPLNSIPYSWQKPLWSKLLEQFNSKQLAHGFLLTGATGLGKKLFAEEFSRLLLCRNVRNGKTCNQCRSCELSSDFNHPDLVQVDVEEGSKDIKIEQIRSLSHFLSQTSHSGNAKVAIIANAHRMNVAAANALLKTLEEPTAHTYLFLISHLPGSLTATIRSRCQKLQMPTPNRKQALEWLAPMLSGQHDPDALLRVASNRALHALELAESEGLNAQKQFLTKLVELSAGNASIQATSALASKLGEQPVMGYLSEVSTILIKYLLINQEPKDLEPEHRELLSVLCPKNHANRQFLQNLMRYNQQLSIAQRQLMSGTNPNPQLIVESLLWRWSHLRDPSYPV